MMANGSVGGSPTVSDGDDEPVHGNRLLADLPSADRERLVSRAELVHVPAGEVICEPGQPSWHVHFPISGVLSSVVLLANGSVVEVAIIGNEGLAGITSVHSVPSGPTRIVQRMKGEALRVPAADVQELLASSQLARGVIGRYTLTLFQQCAQNVACNLHHRLEERMCRWLLATADRAEQLELRLTQEFLGEMLGVSRQSVNATAGALQSRGLISYSRGRLVIVDRGGLESASCECYESTRSAYRKLMRAA